MELRRKVRGSCTAGEDPFKTRSRPRRTRRKDMNEGLMLHLVAVLGAIRLRLMQIVGKLECLTRGKEGR
jgi:hypothetical protein